MKLPVLPTSAGAHVHTLGRSQVCVAGPRLLVTGGLQDSHGGFTLLSLADDGTPAVTSSGATAGRYFSVSAVAAPRGGEMVALADRDDRTVGVWALPGLEMRGALCRTTLPVRAIAFSPDDELV